MDNVVMHPKADIKLVLVNLITAQANQMLVETGFNPKPNEDNVLQFNPKEKTNGKSTD